MRTSGAVALFSLLILGSSTAARAGEPGSVSGRVLRQDGAALSGVMVLLQETGVVEWTAADGTYRFDKVRPGRCTLLFTLASYSATLGVDVLSTDSSAVPDFVVDWPLSFVETMVVSAASKQVEQLIDAPASVLAFDAKEIARQSGQGQLPLMLAAGAGIQAPQSGLYDFNVNARGFNDMVNRRVRIEVDGRDTSQPHVMGYTDWASLPQALGEFEQVEFVRGPGGALYGQGALNGVLSLRSKDPATSLGGKARLTLGELNTGRLDVRHAGALGDGWFFKVVGGYLQSADFAESRVDGVEYEPALLAREVVPLPLDRLHVAYGSGRVDKHLGSGATLVMEGGMAYKEGPVTLTNLGRYQALDVRFPWARGEYRSSAWKIVGAYTGADLNEQLGLSTGSYVYMNSTNLQLDAQTARDFRKGRGRLVAGGSYNRQHADSANPQGVQTSFEEAQTASSGAVFAQVNYDVTSRVSTSVAARVDASSLTRTTFSPRAAAVWEVAAGQRLRVAYSDAFKAPSLAEARLLAAIAPPLNLSGLESALAPVLGGTSLGFAQVPLLAVGNEQLDVEEVRSLEAGYSVVLAQRTFLQAAYYHNWHNTFTSGLLPQVGTSLGRLNPAFGPYQPPSTLPAASAAIVQASLALVLPPSLFASMSNLDDGRPVFAVLSLGNFGTARTQGIELSSQTLLPSGWRVDVGYSWFDAEVDADSPETPLEPNTPHHQASGGLVYVHRRFDAGGRVRWVDGFKWVSGVYAGPVPSYTVIDVQANVPLSTRLALGVDVANLFDNAHHEMFGGDVLGRRALAHLTVGW
ncbi:MAG: TonB-dependent receptor [Vicinamibacteria bacterium]|nr:TonB-dependent receptor [Vicinamibacteria bacterium]